MNPSSRKPQSITQDIRPGFRQEGHEMLILCILELAKQNGPYKLLHMPPNHFKFE